MSSKSRGSIAKHHQPDMDARNETISSAPPRKSLKPGSSSRQQSTLSPTQLGERASTGLRPVYQHPGAVRVRGPDWEDGASWDEGTVQIGSEGPSVVEGESQSPHARIERDQSQRQAPVEDSPKRKSRSLLEVLRKNKILISILLLLIVCGVVLGIVFGVVLKKDEVATPSSVFNPTAAPTAAPTTTMSPTTRKEWTDAGEIQASNGASLSFSPDGTQVAVIDSRFDLGDGGAVFESSIVQVYQEEGGIWSLLGNSIDVTSSQASLSLLGSRLAVGSVGSNEKVIVYELQDNVWNQVGDDINSEGWTVALARDGTVVAVEETDRVQLYRFNGNDWAPKGDSMPTVSTRSNPASAYSRMDISSNGLTVIVDQSVYTFSDDLAFYYGTAPLLKSSPPDTPVSISQDGKVLAIAQPEFNVNATNNAGKVTIFRFNGTEWKQAGNAISGQVANERFGWSLSLSGNGERIVIMNNSGGESNKATVYTLRGSNWIPVLDDVPIAFNNGKVSISNDGNRVAVGGEGRVVFYDIVG